MSSSPTPRTATPAIARPPILVLLLLFEFGAGGALYPYLALFLLQKELSPAELAAVMLSAAASSTVMLFLWGWVADRLVALDRLVPALHLASAGLLLWVVRLDAFVPIFLALTVFNGLRHPAFTLVTALCYHNLSDPPRQFGRLRLWGSIGWILPAVPIYLLHLATGSADMSYPVLVAASLHLGVVVMSPFLPHTPPPARPDERPANEIADGAAAGASGIEEDRTVGIEYRPSRYRDALFRLLGSRDFVLLLLACFLVMSAFSVMFYYSNLRLREAGIPSRHIGLVLAAGVIPEIPLFLTLGRVIARFGFAGTLAIGAAASVVRQLTFGLSMSAWWIAAASLLLAPCVVYFLIASSLAANAFAPREVRATAQSLVTLTGSGLGMMAGLAATYLLTRWSGGDMATPFLFAAATSLSGLLVLGFLRKGRRAGSPRIGHSR